MARPSKPIGRFSSINQFALVAKISPAYATRLLSDTFTPHFALAISIYQRTGVAVGVMKEIVNEDKRALLVEAFEVQQRLEAKTVGGSSPSKRGPRRKESYGGLMPGNAEARETRANLDELMDMASRMTDEEKKAWKDKRIAQQEAHEQEKLQTNNHGYSEPAQDNDEDAEELSTNPASFFD